MFSGFPQPANLTRFLSEHPPNSRETVTPRRSAIRVYLERTAHTMYAPSRWPSAHGKSEVLLMHQIYYPYAEQLCRAQLRGPCFLGWSALVSATAHAAPGKSPPGTQQRPFFCAGNGGWTVVWQKDLYPALPHHQQPEEHSTIAAVQCPIPAFITGKRERCSRTCCLKALGDFLPFLVWNSWSS